LKSEQNGGLTGFKWRPGAFYARKGRIIKPLAMREILNEEQARKFRIFWFNCE
jgi:hypothetical protein